MIENLSLKRYLHRAYHPSDSLEIVSIVLIAVALAMDAFAVSLCKGLAMKRPDLKSVIIIALWFGTFQALMPVIGYLLGSSMYDLMKDYDHWIAFGLLFLIGANMIRESFSEEEEMDADIYPIPMLILAIATSIDAFAVGISLAMDGSDIISSVLIIGVITFLISAVGVKIGAKVGGILGKRAELFGGLILIVIGVKIVLEHTGVI